MSISWQSRTKYIGTNTFSPFHPLTKLFWNNFSKVFHKINQLCFRGEGELTNSIIILCLCQIFCPRLYKNDKKKLKREAGHWAYYFFRNTNSEVKSGILNKINRFLILNSHFGSKESLFTIAEPIYHHWPFWN